ncbi:peptidoglycan DD-metalloendopeptidase family protein [Polaribacter dokdonensis]|uniref:Murein DD-endopeptidase MepM and murein hydrolase activator NlpD, contain LysM domain n=1 Tax=Polaribacter dokdonensis DSW-5 TaxID=1300348 RepID=A0A0N0CFA6_9FLAO|nr:peptidoglycan DD-metalloendopeptidase family protein [Polaribacter dokdonensis]KOY51514.1 Peptidase, M23/M37 family [Polaribacter dokdonensis DSW-5]SEE09763.1 Murein DD-endopeptidase MepM and murein hydrolase activator NlpD, contain LysM domain [Polaribacter dokdonensis DSW-5]
MKNIVILFVFILAFTSCKEEDKAPESQKIVEPEPEIRFGYKIDDYKVIQDTIKSGESFGIILDRHHVFYPKINQIAATVKETFDVRKVRAGKPYTILASKDSTEKAQVFIYKHDKINATIVDFKDSVIVAKKYKKPIKLVEKVASGVVNSNFTISMDSLGLRPNLTYKVADIYAWTLDFLRLQKGDSFKIVYEEKFIDDSTFAGYGNVKSAVFKHKGKDLYAFRFLADSTLNIHEYYDDEANMLRSQFLKAPIKFQYRISSRYNLRRRIAYYGNKIRPHRGTDFAAKIGTPIIATASGTVTESTRRGGNGKYVKIKHNSTYSTQYLHMSKQAVKKGQYVKQGDVIGYVGMTGNTGGPHVCYRFWKYGKQVDPLREKLPAAEPMKKNVKPSFFEYIKPLKYQLDYERIEVPEPQEVKEIIAQK